ncbi:pectinesterase [Ranunculus cassubicifolius]
MNTVQSFKGYGKVDERDEAAFQQKTRRRCIIIVVSVLVLTAVVIGAVVGTLANRNNDEEGSSQSTQTSTAESIKAVCSVTQYPESCLASLSSSVNGSTKLNPEQLIKLSMDIALQELSKLSVVPDTLISRTTDPYTKKALVNCKYLFQDSVDQLNASIASMDVGSVNLLLSATKIDDLKTWISTAITNQETCLDGLDESEKKIFVEEMKKVMQNSSEFTSNSLAIVTKIMKVLKDLNIPTHRKLLSYVGLVNDNFPTWVNSADRRLLQAETKPIADITVAKDGTGDYLTISEAVKAVAEKNKTRTVIYVKEGKYAENVFLDKVHWNIMMIGDGMTKTIVSGSLNFIEGTPTFTTATFIAAGRGFICMDMGFENTAGPDKHQAVAMRSGSDQSVFYRCAFDAYQDTLYAHSNRQFYRDCEIWGTIDFIFGNAAVVFQGCKIRPRKPMANQFITVTAQGKKDPNQNTGISIQRSVITPLDSFTADIYLGRPWKDFSTTIIMETEISQIHPKGWIEWIRNVDPPSTIFYGEYKNTGPGSIVSGRVNWTGYQPAVSDERAAQFTVKSFIEGGEWLPLTNVAFDPL